MADMPRIITVDPTGNIARIVRSSMDLLDLSIIQVDVPTTGDALEELDRKANLVVTAFMLDDDMKGWEFAMRIKKKSADTSVLILGDSDDPDEFDEETATDSPFVYMSRPVDIHRFLRVLVGGLESHEAMLAALAAPIGGGGGGGGSEDMGPVPGIDISAATKTLDDLLTELGAMALILATRTGEILLERGAVGYIDRDKLAHNLIPIMMANIGIKDMVGGNVSTVQLYDGEDYDIFVLTVGLHHMLCVVFDGSQGARQFGLVNRYGRRAVEDLIALIGANAFFIMPPVKREDSLPHKSTAAKKKKTQEAEIALAPAFEADEEPGAPAEPEPVPQLDAIPDDEFDLDALFGSGDGDIGNADDLFDLEKMEELAKDDSTQRKDVISWEDAEGLGLINKK